VTHTRSYLQDAEVPAIAVLAETFLTAAGYRFDQGGVAACGVTTHSGSSCTVPGMKFPISDKVGCHGGIPAISGIDILVSTHNDRPLPGPSPCQCCNWPN